MNYEVKYKSCRAAFVKMSSQYNREKKNRLKDRQRIIQLCEEIIKGEFYDEYDEVDEKAYEILEITLAELREIVK